MFKFKFAAEDHGLDEDHVETTETLWKECKEIVYKADERVEDILRQVEADSVSSKHNEIKCFRPKEVLKVLKAQNLGENSILQAEQNHSDLLPAVYEGGLKIWECTQDLLSYINECDVDFTDKKVLDLGCGAGIIGIALLLKGANCWFQDYNSDVIQFLTIPNILLNSRDGVKTCKYYSGDWKSFVDLVGDSIADDTNKFDYIFTSETIYNTETYPKLHRVFEKLLKKEGVMYPLNLQKQFWMQKSFTPAIFKSLLRKEGAGTTLVIMNMCVNFVLNKDILNEVLEIYSVYKISFTPAIFKSLLRKEGVGNTSVFMNMCQFCTQ